MIPALLLFAGCEEEVTSEPNPHLPVGVNIHTASDPDVAKMKAMGATWVRIDVPWWQVEPGPPEMFPRNFQVLDRVVAQADRLGLRIFASLGGTPGWASSTGKVNGVPSAERWRAFVRAVIDRYPSLRHIGVWNEPNLEEFWSGSAMEYLTVLLRPAYEEIKAKDPSLKVLGPELGLYASKSRKKMKEYLKKIRQGRYDRYIDIVTLHTYHEDVHEFREKLGDLRRAVLRYGFANKPVWLTEFGWDSNEVGETAQGFRLAEALQLLARMPWIEQAFLYEMRDDPGHGPKWGLLRADGKEKPAFEEVRATIERGFRPPEPPPEGGGGWERPPRQKQ